ncbi:MAG: hypothetical protein RIS90_1764 [Pseudomonadota bacterium]|jgi:hypothetical protein
MTSHRLITILALFWLAPKVSAQPAETIGPLFFNSAERRAIVQGRSGPVEQAALAPRVLSLSGVLVRDGGKGTVWVNGQAFPEGHSPFPGIPLTIKRGHIKIKNETVRPGETLDLTNRDRVDILAPGTFSLRPSR